MPAAAAKCLRTQVRDAVVRLFRRRVPAGHPGFPCISVRGEWAMMRNNSSRRRKWRGLTQAEPSTAMKFESFQSNLRSGHKGNAVQVPFDPRARWSIPAQPLWPGRRGFPVHAKLNGVAFDSAIVARSRMFWLLVPAEVSSSARVLVGEPCSIAVAPANSFEPTPLRGAA